MDFRRKNYPPCASAYGSKTRNIPFDFKKELKDIYLPKAKPGFVEVPKINYLAVCGKGDPNAEDGEYKQSIGLLYAIAFTLKMSSKGSRKIDGFFYKRRRCGGHIAQQS